MKKSVVKSLVGGAAAAALVCMLVEVTLVAPRVEARNRQRAERERVAAENERNEATLADYDEFLARKAEVDERYVRATGAVPTEAELATVLESVRSLALETGVKLVSFTPEAPPRTKSKAEASAGILSRRQVRVVVRGDYADVKGLLAALAGYSRLLTVEKFDARTSTVAGFALEATLELSCYFKSAPQPDVPSAPVK